MTLTGESLPENRAKLNRIFIVGYLKNISILVLFAGFFCTTAAFSSQTKEDIPPLGEEQKKTLYIQRVDNDIPPDIEEVLKEAYQYEEIQAAKKKRMEEEQARKRDARMAEEQEKRRHRRNK